jgi:hypothetical protein
MAGKGETSASTYSSNYIVQIIYMQKINTMKRKTGQCSQLADIRFANISNFICHDWPLDELNFNSENLKFT